MIKKICQLLVNKVDGIEISINGVKIEKCNKKVEIINNKVVIDDEEPEDQEVFNIEDAVPVDVVITGNANIDTLTTIGELKVEGNLSSHSIETSDNISIDGNLECNSVESYDMAVKGDFKADVVNGNAITIDKEAIVHEMNSDEDIYFYGKCTVTGPIDCASVIFAKSINEEDK